MSRDGVAFERLTSSAALPEAQSDETLATLNSHHILANSPPIPTSFWQVRRTREMKRRSYFYVAVSSSAQKRDSREAEAKAYPAFLARAVAAAATGRGAVAVAGGSAGAPHDCVL